MFTIIVIIITPILIQAGGSLACFVFYGSVSFIGFLDMIFFLKDTTYAEEDLGNKIVDYKFQRKRLLSEKEKKELYMPDKYKEN